MASAPRAASSFGSSAGGLHRGEVVARDAGDVFLHVQGLAGPLAVDLRDHDVGITLEVLGEPLDVARLAREIQLALERAREVAGDLHRQVAARLRHLGLDQLGDVEEDPEIGVDLGADAGAADLEHHRRPILELRAVHLRDRRRAERPRIELAEHLERRPAERALELGQEVVEGDRRDLALELLELGDPVRREEVDAGGHHLPELDERRPQLPEREAQPLRRLEPDGLDLRAPVENLPGALEDVGNADPADDVAQAVPDEDRGDLVEAREVPHHSDGFAQHYCALSGLSFFSAACSADPRSASASPPRIPLATAATRAPK